MALANDSAVREGEIVGDPTEAALVVLAEKGGLDVEETRRFYPRVAEVPFDSEYKLMATFHEMETDGRKIVRCYVKGAPDVLLARSSHGRDVDGSVVSIDSYRDRVLAENDRLAAEGLRVLAVASRDIDPSGFDAAGDLLEQVQGLTLLALVGIVDPPRKEAKDAIARCKEAGIRARMITGDHATTAAAIAAQLGIEGRALTGTEFSALTDAELDDQVDSIGVVARVAPEDKVRLVDVLKRKGHVVSMTGDGVNDAPALKRSDIGVAMGITGTEVTKEAADMILTDDNFTTIVAAVEGGRGDLRQPHEVRASAAHHARRLHPHLRRRGNLRHRRRHTADAAPDPLDQLRRRRRAGDRAGLRRGRSRADAAGTQRRQRARRRIAGSRSGSASPAW